MNSTGGTDEYESTADLYDHVVPYHDRPDVQFFVDAARERGGPVLELGCGTGRVLIPTARAGLDIVGLDSSPHMLSVCRNRVGDEPESVRSKVELVEADMRAFALDRTFALVTMPFRPFQHLISVEDQLACLGCIRRHLRDGGTLLLDLFNPSLEHLVNTVIGEEFAEEPEFTMPDGRRVIRRHKVAAHDRANQTTDVELIYYVTHSDGRSERRVHAFRFRYLFRFEVEHLLARAGFEVETIYSDYERSAFGSKYPGELIVVARRT